jgi:hypothetical protein
MFLFFFCFQPHPGSTTQQPQNQECGTILTLLGKHGAGRREPGVRLPNSLVPIVPSATAMRIGAEIIEGVEVNTSKQLTRKGEHCRSV